MCLTSHSKLPAKQPNNESHNEQESVYWLFLFLGFAVVRYLCIYCTLWYSEFSLATFLHAKYRLSKFESTLLLLFFVVVGLTHLIICLTICVCVNSRLMEMLCRKGFLTKRVCFLYTIFTHLIYFYVVSVNLLTT